MNFGVIRFNPSRSVARKSVSGWSLNVQEGPYRWANELFTKLSVYSSSNDISAHHPANTSYLLRNIANYEVKYQCRLYKQ
jgi:hypothetical protein